MVRFYVGRRQPGSTVLLSEAHHVVEAPPYMLPPVKEGSMIDLEISIDKAATEARQKEFSDLQKRIHELAEADYFKNTPPALCIYPDVTEIVPNRVYVCLSKLPADSTPLPQYLAPLNIKYVLEVVDIDKPEPLAGVVEIKHLRLEEGTRNIAYLFDDVIDFIETSSKKGIVLLHGLTDQIACFAIAYLMRSRMLRLAQAAAHVRKRLPGVAPNFAFISQLTNFEARLFGDTDSVYLAEYVMETLPGWDASLEDVTKALRQFDNDVAKAMDMLCPSPSHEQEQAQQNQAE